MVDNLNNRDVLDDPRVDSLRAYLSDIIDRALLDPDEAFFEKQFSLNEVLGWLDTGHPKLRQMLNAFSRVRKMNIPGRVQKALNPPPGATIH